MEDTRSCDCSQPWPKMVRLGISGLDRYYLCLECASIRHETAPGPGLLDDIRICHLHDCRLPEVVWREARRVLDRPSYIQPALFSNDLQAE